MNNLTKYLISFALLCLSNVAISETIEFSINCKILDQVFLDVNDGKSTTSQSYSGFKEVGDTITFYFQYKDYEKDDAYLISVEQYQKGIDWGSIKFREYGVINGGYRGMSHHADKRDGLLMFEDSLYFSTPFLRLTGKRYYKSDWSFFHSGGRGQKGFIQTLNCMNFPSDAYDRMMGKIYNFHVDHPIKPK